MSWPVDHDPVFGCWLWRGDQSDGYGFVYRGGSRLKAHLAVYSKEVGPVPDGKVLDHECRRRLCVNPAHLTPVTQRENLLRRSWRHRVAIRTCRNGHSMADAMVTDEGGRLCRTCAKT